MQPSGRESAISVKVSSNVHIGRGQNNNVGRRDGGLDIIGYLLCHAEFTCLCAGRSAVAETHGFNARQRCAKPPESPMHLKDRANYRYLP